VLHAFVRDGMDEEHVSILNPVAAAMSWVDWMDFRKIVSLPNHLYKFFFINPGNYGLMFVTYAARIQGYTIFPPKNNTYKLFTILKKKQLR
jgi:hypothetical protein